MPAPAERTVAGIKCGEVLSRLSEFLDGEIGWPLRDQIIQHLCGCQWCERFGGRFSAGAYVKNHDIRDHFCRIDLDSFDLCETLG